MPGDTRCWLQRPRSADKPSTDKGEVRSKRVVVALDQPPCPVAALAARLPAASWYRRPVSAGTKGPSTDEFARQRVTLWKAGLPERTVWLVLTRTVGAEPSYAYASSHAPASTPWSRFVGWSGLRWAIEQCCEASKTALGMDQYAVRTYPGWHHHRLTTRLAHFFLWHLKRRLGEKSAGADGVTAPSAVGRRVTSPPLYDCGEPCTPRVGATASSPCLSITSKATRGRGLNKVTL